MKQHVNSIATGHEWRGLQSFYAVMLNHLQPFSRYDFFKSSITTNRNTIIMIDALISGKLIKAPELKTGQSGKYYCQFLLSVSVGETVPIVVSGMAFQDVAEKIAKLGKGDALSVVGALKPSEWVDKATGVTKHGLSITVSASLSAYDIKKRRPKVDNPANQDFGNNGANSSRYDSMPFNDPLTF